MSTIHIGFIGLGEHQIRAHVIHLHNLKLKGADIELSGFYDPNPLAHEELPKRIPDIKSYVSDTALLCDPYIDVVFIGSPDKFHADQLLAAVKAGKHVFCEKPMAVSTTDMTKVCDALMIATEKGLVVSTCHPRRFDPPCVWLKQAMPSLIAQYGALKHFDFSFWYHEVTDPWKMTDRKLLSDHFGHEIDILRYLLGKASVNINVVADSYDYYETTGIAGNFSDKGGYSFRFSGSRNLKESVYQESIRLDFEKGAIFLYLNKGEGIILPEGSKFTFPPMDYDVRFLKTNADFINAIRGEGESYLTPDDIYCNNWLSVTLSNNGKANYLHNK